MSITKIEKHPERFDELVSAVAEFLIWHGACDICVDGYSDPDCRFCALAALFDGPRKRPSDD